MTNCNDLTLECNIKSFDDCDIGKKLDMNCFDNMEDKLLLFLNSEKFKYNSDGSINNNKIEKAKFYEISAKYVYDEEFLKKVSNTILFKNYLNSNTKIEQIDYRKNS